MAQFGPLPKNPEDRIRRNKTGDDGLGDEVFQMEGEVKPPRGVKFEQPVVQAIWDALLISVNRKFYEPTDWAYAVLTLTQWDNVIQEGKAPGAMLLTALDNMSSKLLLTEGDRRRMKIFAKREKQEAKVQVKASDFYRKTFEEQQRQRRLNPVPDERTG
jgi:hypothetical protein